MKQNHPLKRAISLLDRYLEEVLCAILIVGMLCSIFLQVVLRYVFESPVSWSDEIAIYCLIGTVYFGASLAVRERAHIRLMVFVQLFPRPYDLMLFLVGEAIWLGFNTTMMILGWKLFEIMSRFTLVSPSLGIDQRWTFALVMVGFTLMIFRMLQEYYRWFAEGKINMPEIIHD